MTFKNGPLDLPGASAPDMAKHYITNLGFSLITCESYGKKPSDNWMTQVVTADDCDRKFDPRIANVAVKLGAPSRGLVDCDLDWKATVPFANLILAALPAFGRPKKPYSHRVALCPQALEVDACRQVAFTLPGTMKGHPGLPTEHALCVAELRGNGGYTVFPPSTYDNGKEPITYDPEITHLPSMAWNDLREKLGLVAVLAVFAQFYPPEGVRNNFSLALGGALCGYMARKPAFISLAPQVAGTSSLRKTASSGRCATKESSCEFSGTQSWANNVQGRW